MNLMSPDPRDQAKETMSESFTIRPEKPADQAAIEHLIVTSFGREERKKRTVYQFRDGIAPLSDLSLVASTATGKLVGSLRFWPCKLPAKLEDESQIPLLGPLAVLPELRGQGAGRALVSAGLSLVREKAFPAVLIVGDPGYYAPQGFSVAVVQNLWLPGPVVPLTFMGMEIEPGFLSTRSGPVVPATSD